MNRQRQLPLAQGTKVRPSRAASSVPALRCGKVDIHDKSILAQIRRRCPHLERPFSASALRSAETRETFNKLALRCALETDYRAAIIGPQDNRASRDPSSWTCRPYIRTS